MADSPNTPDTQTPETYPPAGGGEAPPNSARPRKFDWLKLLQVAALVVVGVLVAEYAFWSWLNAAEFVWLTTVAGLVTAFVALVWKVIKGSGEDWRETALRSAIRFFLSTVRRAAITLAVCATAAAVFGGVLIACWMEEHEKRKQPNYLVYLFYGSRNQPASRATVTVRGLLSRKQSDGITDSEGLAQFRVDSASDRLWQTFVSVERDGEKRSAILPADQNITLPFIKEVDLNGIRKEEWKVAPAQFADARSESQAAFRASLAGATEVRGDRSSLPTHLPWGMLDAKIVGSRPQYAYGFDPERRIPRWVAYRINQAAEGVRRRGDPFLPDPLLPEEIQATSEAYANNPYDRGNLVSRTDVTGYGPEAEQVVNYMSVVAPQIDRLNQGAWMHLEQYARGFADEYRVWVMAGPVFAPGADGRVSYPVIGGNVAVPTHFFRIIVRTRDDASPPEAIGFVVPNETTVGRDFKPFAAPIGKIEELTGLKFFNNLSEQEQRRLKSEPTALW